MCFGISLPRRFLLAFATSTFLFMPVSAQDATLIGTVTDPSGSVVPGAEIILSSQATGADRTTITDETGRYQFAQVAPGLYTIKAELAGFKTSLMRDVALRVDKATRLDLQLELGEMTEVLTISAQTESLVNRIDATVGNNFSGTQIAELPLESRNVANLLSIQPGAVSSGEVAGARRGMSNITLDGIDINEQQNGSTTVDIGPDAPSGLDNVTDLKGLADSAFQPVLRVTPDSVQEFRVTVSNPNADQGRSSGAQVSLVTKSGTNQWHGSLYEFHRNTVTTANDFFNNRVVDGDGNSDPIARPALIRNLYGGSLGGPIARDKAFFFFNYEGRKDRSQQSDVEEVPLAHLGQGEVRFINTNGVLQTVGPEEIAQFFPEAGGVNPVAVAALGAAAAAYPSNDTSVGDQLNTSGFRFNGSTPLDWNTYTAKLDFNLSDSQTLYLRGNYQWDSEGFLSQFPGTPSPTLWRHPIGFAVGHTWNLRPTVINTFRYGLTRDAFSNQGDSADNLIQFRFVYRPRIFQRTLSRTTPVHNFVNDTSWIVRNHTFQFGTNIRTINNNRDSFNNAFDSAIMNPSYWAVSSDSLDINASGQGNDVWRNGITAVLGRYSQFTGRFTFDQDGSLLAAGSPTVRDFATEEYDFYFGDTWQVNSELTVNFGLRWGVNTAVHETSGFEVAPTVSLSEVFDRRVAGARAGQPYNDPVIIDTAGPFYGKPGIYPTDKNNWQPRISAAWSPRFGDNFWGSLFGRKGESVFRGGFSMLYDRIGSALAVSFDLNNQLGFVSQSETSANTFHAHNDPGPLFTGFDQDVRPLLADAGLPIPDSLQFPLQQPSDEAQRIEESLDASLKSPVHYNYSLSYGRELPGGLFIEASYIGRRARDLLAERDVMHLNNFVDPASGMDWYTAFEQLFASRVASTPPENVAPIPFFENLFPDLDDYYFEEDLGLGPTQTAALLISPLGEDIPDWTYLQLILDDAGPIKNMFFHPQYGALSVFSTIAQSDYDALAVTVRERFKNSLTAGLNYTWSKSLDWSSFGGGASQDDYASILNPLTPSATRGPSNFDHTHIINSNWLWELPFGRGHRWGDGVTPATNAILGGWQLNGVFRWNSGRAHEAPFEGSRWATNWNAQSRALRIRDPNVSPTKSGDNPRLFDDRVFSYQSFRDALAGEVGDRNPFRRQGYVALDFAVYKAFRMPYAEGHELTFRWEVFNATNTQHLGDARITRTEFATSPLPQFGQPTPTFGNITSIQGTPRVMQFGLRYAF